MLAVFTLGAAHGGRVITRILPILFYVDGVPKKLLIIFFTCHRILACINNEFHTH